ncbi:putative reverse transcriptase domain-containing protein [Tanacetum coccineum]|uniref:Reverse transcriptase domain-containing protein n=1 Tax=Tanacetum coccineum TaxID=301880 RepID=A0ABQ5EL79_9ASTR
MGCGTRYYSLGVFLAIVDAFVRSEGGAIDGSEAIGIIRDPKLELESSCFTFDLVPLSYESVDVVIGENWLLRHKAEMVCHEKVVKMPCVPKELVGFTPRRRMGFRMELVQGATLICEGLCRLTSLERQEVWNDCRSCKVKVGSNGNLWEASVLLGRKKGCVMDTLKFTAMPFGLTNAPAVFMELMSRRDVRTLAIEEAYTTKYSIHPGADMMLCGFRLTNRWLIMKKDIASCGSKHIRKWKLSIKGLQDLLMPRVVKSRDEIFSRWGYCDNHDLSRLDNQSIERDRLIGIGFVLNFVKFISFTFGDKEMISVIEAVSR